MVQSFEVRAYRVSGPGLIEHETRLPYMEFENEGFVIFVEQKRTQISAWVQMPIRHAEQAMKLMKSFE